MVEILPSILSADFARLADDIARLEGKSPVQTLHVDVMDGHFVPNITIGPPVVRSLRKATRLKLDVHLMIENPDAFISEFVQAGANSISVHQETCPHLDRTVHAIQSEGALAGVVLNPATPVSALEDILEAVDYVLVMSVNPGFGAQRMIPNCLRKAAKLKRLREELGLHFAIEIDGGVNLQNVGDVARAGCDWIVAGSSVFGSEDPATTVAQMLQLANAATAIHV